MDLIFLLCASLLFLLMLLQLSKSKKPNLNLPPGPKRLPIIGNMHQLARGLLHHNLRNLANVHGPLMHLKLGQISTIVVSSAEVAKEVLRTHDLNFAHRPSGVLSFEVISYGFKDIVLSPYGSNWRQLRQIAVSELLSQRRVKTFRFTRETEVANLVIDMYTHRGSIVNLSKKIFSLTYAITARASFGKVKKEDQTRFMDMFAEFNKLILKFNVGDWYPCLKVVSRITGLRQKMVKIHKEMDVILESLLEEHKKKVKLSVDQSEEVKEDLIDILLRVQTSGDLEVPLTDDSIKGVVLNIFIAGGDTSATTVEWAMAELMKHPHMLKRAQDEVRNLCNEEGNVVESRLEELEYLQAIVKEILRLHPPGPLLVPRECREECKINGYDIPRKARLMVNAWAIGRDPKYWTQPEVFDPDRFFHSKIDYKGNDFEYIPFSSGRRICPGMAFAEPNILLPLAQLLFHFDWKLAKGIMPEELDMDENAGMAVARKNHLEIIPTPYHLSNIAI